MKNTLYASILVCIVCLMTSETKAQSCPNPSGCIYGDVTVTINYQTNRVQGYSYAQADYTAGLNFNPQIRGAIYRTDNPEIDLASGISTGNGSATPAVINMSTANFVNGMTYCNYTTFFAVRRSTGQITNIGWMQDCKSISVPPPPTPTPSPTPTPCVPLYGLPCSTPTPTPTPTPAPAATVRAIEVGFKGDRLIRQFEVSGNPYIDYPDGTVPTWKRNNNPDFPVAYMKGTSPTVFAKFTISPTLTTSQTAQIRIKKDSSIITSPREVQLIGSELSVNDIGIPFSNLESSQFIKKSKYDFTWQISFDNGTNWRDMEGDSKHDVHWVNSNPPDEAGFRPFRNSAGTEYQGLFDKALEWSTGKVNSNEADIQKVIQKINSRVAGMITYNPSINSYGQNPLGILNGENGGEAVCGDNALVLSGLLRSIGLDGVQEKYHWGGHEATSKRNYYCPPGGCTSPTTERPLGNRVTMQAKRDQLGCSGFPECIERNPSFTYHATVIHDGRSFDPSYGIAEGDVELLTAINVPPVGEPDCVHGAAATALRVSRDSFGDIGLSNNNNTNKVCSPRLSSIYSGAKLFRFDALGGADIAIVRLPTGQWVVKNEFGEELDLQALAYDPLQDALTPADYDGDGLTDPAVWYGTGEFFFRMSSNYYKVTPSFWRPKSFDEKAVPGDYDGDGISDIALWRASDGMWIMRRSSGGPDIEVQWGSGSLGDVPVPGDYDGDGKTDVAVWRASTGDWWVLRSSDGSYAVTHFGMTGDVAVQGDYDGDGMTDYAVVRPSTGAWYFLESENNYQFRAYSGPVLGSNDLPVPADYNSDSKTDVAVWFGSTGTWHIVDSQTGETRQDVLGQKGDLPIMSASVFRQ